jgi:hypothetical protein
MPTNLPICGAPIHLTDVPAFFVAVESKLKLITLAASVDDGGLASF